MAFTITNEFTKRNNRFKLTQHYIQFKLNPLDRKTEDPVEWLKKGLRNIFDHLINNLDQGDKVGITFTGTELQSDHHLPFQKASDVNFEQLWDRLYRIYQSNKGGVESDTFRIISTSFTPLRAGGRTNDQFTTFKEECNKRRGIITIKNKDNLCLPRALVVAIAYVMNLPYIAQIRRNIGKRQDQEAQKLIQESGIQIPSGGAGLQELRRFQNYLEDFKITVYSYGSKGRDILFEGPDAPNKINLLHFKNHFNVITSLTAAFNCSYFCDRCHIPYSSKEKHRCIDQCPGCQQKPPCPKVKTEALCGDCNRKFRGECCFRNHKMSNNNGKNLCEAVKRCENCLKTFKGDRQHICNEIFCNICKKYQLSNHMCYIQPDTGKSKLKDTLFVFYDLESRQDVQNYRGEDMHIPVLCVFQNRCDECFELNNKVLECSKCGLRRQVIKGENIIESFLQHLFIESKKFKCITVIAHNGSNYDHHFILQYILEKTHIEPEIIMRGSKILMMAVSKLKFIDSINYFPMKLAALPEAFGLSELKKGYFPHLFNTKENKNYIGPIPPSKFYDPDNMKSGDRETFFKWYDQNKCKLFDLERQMIEYCISDVDILTQACVKFHKMLMEQGNISPFTEAITIPGACNKIFRRNFLVPETIGIIPKNGYRNVDIQSKIATQWLIYEENKRQIEIQYAIKQKEVNIAGVRVDGYCPTTNQIFEFHGCYYHGCTYCFATADRNAPIHEDPSDTLNARYERTLNKTQRLRQKGFEVLETWEHEFRELLKKNKQLKEKLNSHPLLTHLPLHPRDAFYGGRTGCTKSYYKIKENEKIKYVDVCSLYPWVCKYGKFPVGHPKLHIGEDCNFEETTNGLIKCKILPPQNLYHPVLPTKMNDKLMFVLCKTCGSTLNQDDCTHDDEDRALVGVWTSDEVHKAIEKGYKILEIFEIWEYEVTQYNKEKNIGGLFAEMINKFLKIKQEASGWPTHLKTDEEKMKYIEDFFNKEGIRLEFHNIVNNPGLRSLAKLILNSFWGKFAQRQNQSRCSILRQPAELYSMDANPAIDIDHITIINEEALLSSWKYKEEAADCLSTVNIAIAAYVTAQARLKLYSYLEKLEDRVLYYDTDSVIYISRPGEWDVPIGSSLGEMTDEIGEGSFITEFLSAGPKNYSYKVYTPATGEYYQLSKVKGFNLNYKIGQKINMDSMKDMLLSKTDSGTESIIIEQKRIARTIKHEVVTRRETKQYRSHLEKRKFTEDNDSIPYGYKKKKC